MSSIKSMTGFGKSICELPNKKIHIEIKSINSKQLDLQIKLPGIYREKELEIRSLISGVLERGKVDCLIYLEKGEQVAPLAVNKTILLKYVEEFSAIAKEINQPQTEILPMVSRFPDVFSSAIESVDQTEWETLLPAIAGAIEKVDQFRSQEGAALADDFDLRIHNIESMLAEIAPFETKRIEDIRERMAKNLETFVNNPAVDQNRFEQELFYYLEKLDITEEKIRLAKHCAYFKETMQIPSSGKKLGFITQEIGREINTIGSKANDINIQKMVVKMKDELEKIKEQLSNIL